MLGIDDMRDYAFDPGHGTCTIENKEKKPPNQSFSNADCSMETTL